MSKNTGTSELINYFDLGVNGDVGIAGSLDINTIANATTDTDTFLVSDTGIIKYRTGAQLLSDIGAAPATGGSYLPLTGGILTGTTRMDGSGGTVPSITMIYNSGINRLLAPLLRLYGATNEASNYIELFGTLATSNRTINFPDASGTVALTSNIPANPVGGTGTAGQVTYWSSSSEITGISNFLFNASERNLTIDRSLSTLGNAITISKGSDVDQAWLAFRQGGGGNGTWRLGYTGDPYDFTINVGTDSSIGAQTLRIFEDSQNVVVGTAIVDNGTKLQVGGSVNIVGNGSQLLFDSLGQSKSGGIYYTNDFELLINNSRGVGSAIYLGNVNMDFHTNVSGNPRLRIESNGNLGIGTSTPTSSFNARLAIRNEDAANNPTLVLFKNINSASSEDIFRVQSWNGAFNTVASIRANGGATFLNNVGIGTNSLGNFSGLTFTGPFLDVAGVVQIKGTSSNGVAILQFGGDTFRKATIASSIGTEAPYLSFGTASSGSDSSSSERMRITSGGSVLIGTQTNPYNIGSLVVNHNSTFARTYFQRGVELIEIVPSDGTAANFISSSYTASGSAYKPLAFSGRQNPADLYLATSGNVLIGTTTDAGYKLRVNGMSYLDGYNYASSIQYTRAVSNTVNPAGGEGVLIFSGGQAAMRMNSSYTMNFDMYNSGNQFTALQIRQTGNTVQVNSPDNSLCLALAFGGTEHGYLGATSGFGRSLLAYSVNGGYVYLSSSSTWVSASDRNRKKNFENYNKGLSEICNLKPTLFNLKTQSDDEPKIAGLIAQEVGEHIQEAFSDGEFIGIDYNVLTVTIINAIKELKQQLDTLRNENN